MTEEKKQLVDYMNALAPGRDTWIRRSRAYYRDLKKFFADTIPAGSSVLEIGCGTGETIGMLNGGRMLGIDISAEMVKIARAKFPHVEFRAMDAEALALEEKFEYVILSDVLGYFEDLQAAFQELKKVSSPATRIVINYHSFLWLPFLKFAEQLHLKMPQKRLNWLNRNDIVGLLSLEDFEVIKEGRRFLFPFSIPPISGFLNKYVAFLPLVNRLCLTGYIVARHRSASPLGSSNPTVSVVIPARNEEGNIEQAIARMPQFGGSLEIIFIEGHSKDRTLDEIKRVCEKYGDRLNLRYAVQDGLGKGDAVRKGFAMAVGEILMILDADLTVPPEELPKFFQVLVTGKGELVMGSRLVYPMERDSMRTLNILGNKFFSAMFTWILGQRIKDTLCGTKVISKANYERLSANRSYFGEFDPFGDFDLIFGAARMALKIVEIPVRYKARTYGETNISRWRHGWLLLKMTAFAMNRIKFM